MERKQQLANKDILREAKIAARWYEYVPLAILIIDAETRIIDANRAFLKLTGFSLSDLKETKSPWSFWPSSDIATMIQNPKRSRLHLKGLLVKKNKQEINVEIDLKKLTNGSSERYCMLSVIDKSKNAVLKDKNLTEQKLFLNESRYERIFENIPDGIQLIGFDRRYLFINNEAAKQFEMSKTSVIGKHFMELFPQLVNTPALAAIEESLTTKKASRTELKVITKSHKIVWFELSINPVVEGILILSVDITARKKAEELLKNSQEFNQELLECSPNPILVINRDLSIRYANPAFLALTGFKWQEIQGLRTPYPWWGPEDIQTYLAESNVLIKD